MNSSVVDDTLSKAPWYAAVERIEILCQALTSSFAKCMTAAIARQKATEPPMMLEHVNGASN